MALAQRVVKHDEHHGHSFCRLTQRQFSSYSYSFSCRPTPTERPTERPFLQFSFLRLCCSTGTTSAFVKWCSSSSRSISQARVVVFVFLRIAKSAEHNNQIGSDLDGLDRMQKAKLGRPWPPHITTPRRFLAAIPSSIWSSKMPMRSECVAYLLSIWSAANTNNAISRANSMVVYFSLRSTPIATYYAALNHHRQ
jgi:hypothetical protein